MILDGDKEIFVEGSPGYDAGRFFRGRFPREYDEIRYDDHAGLIDDIIRVLLGNL